DVDAGQGTLSRYLSNRSTKGAQIVPNILMPTHIPLKRSEASSREEAEGEERASLEHAFSQLQGTDFVVIDTPGSDTCLSRLAHSYADTLITPLNDSFVDLDLLVKVVPGEDVKSLKPSRYAEFVWEQKKQRLMRDKVTMNWIVVRNRLSNLLSRNKQEMAKVLNSFSGRLGFSVASGFGERVIFRELFVSGLTLLDLEKASSSSKIGKFSLSHVAAKQELRNLIQSIQLPLLQEKLQQQVA
ncbi:MAG: ATPase, partial [bacterium]|nr:ATPase [bacterium]